MEKICFKCNIKKPLSMFYKHKKMGDGHLNKCIECTKKDTKERTSILLNDENWVKSEQKRHREKYYRLGYKNKHKQNKDQKIKFMSRYKDKYPEKVKARNASSSCFSVLGHNHHWSYRKEHHKDVIDILPKNHLKAHRFIVYDQERMMYRDLNGVLLDTKEKHLKYIMDKIENEDD